MVLSVMNVFFLTILSLSLSGAMAGMLILAIRPLTGKIFSRKWNYYIWFLVIFRLLLPVQLTTVLPGSQAFDISKEVAEAMPGEIGRETNSVQSAETDGGLNSVQPVETDEGLNGVQPAETDGRVESIQSAQTDGSDAAPAGVVHEEPNTPVSSAEESSSPASLFLLTAEIIWMIGVIAALGIKLWNYCRYLLLIKKDAHPVADDRVMVLAQSVSARLHLRKAPAICESASVSGPVTVGLRKPVIILPENAVEWNQAGGDSAERKQTGQNPSIQDQLILHHELVHVARRDLWYKWLYQLLLCIHWFNPFLYLFGRKMNMDCELSCDEGVLAELTAEGRKAYGNVLLDIAEQGAALRTNAFATTFVTGESGLKKRLNAILHYKKTTVPRLLLSLCVMAGAIFLTACGSVYFYDSSAEENFAPDGSGGAGGGVFAEEKNGGFWDEFLENVRIDQNGEAYQLYDDDELLSGEDLSDKWQAYNYTGGGDKITISRFALNGSYSVRIVYAARDTDIEAASSFDLEEGRFKVIHVAPDGSIETLNDTGEKSSTTVTMQKGRNVIKIVGQAAALKSVEISFSGLKEKDFEAVYHSEEDEYAGQIMEAVKSGNVEKDKFMDCLYYIEEADNSEVFAALLRQGAVFSKEDLVDIFLYSDAERSGEYLVDAINDGLIEPLDVDTLSEIIFYVEGGVAADLLKTLPVEDFPEGLEECGIYLSEEGLKECLDAYIAAGGRLSYTQLSDLEMYLDRDTIEELYEKMALPAEAGEPGEN